MSSEHTQQADSVTGAEPGSLILIAEDRAGHP